MTMMQAPVLRGSFEDSLPSDLRELATWLNKRLPDSARPRCSCGDRRRVVYAPEPHLMLWGCPNYKTCGAKTRPVDESRLYAYAKKRLRHTPKDCVRARTS